MSDNLSLEVKVAVDCLGEFLKPLKVNDCMHRYKSWEICFSKFQTITEKDDIEEELDNLALNLGFYLASWGMMRGSSFLLQLDYEVHKEVISTIFKDWNRVSRLREFAWDPKSCTDEVWLDLDNLRKEIIKDYRDVMKNQNMEQINASETLVTKILMGTLGCTVAYDSNLKYALGQLNGIQKFGKNSMTFICKYYKDEYNHIVESFSRKYGDIKLNTSLYPPMKILDMIFWQYGKMYKPKSNKK